jgi:Fe-S-cluster containining protein
VTHVDVARLAATLGHTDGWLEWLAPDALDLEGETESLVELREGPRLLVLARVRDSKERTACAFLRDDEGCSVYPQRPACCRSYPFELGEPAQDADPSTRRVRLKLHHDALCDSETGIDTLRIGPNLRTSEETSDDAATRAAQAIYDTAQRELASYVALASEWNRRQRRRRLTGRLPETGDEFLRRLLQAPSRSSHSG